MRVVSAKYHTPHSYELMCMSAATRSWALATFFSLALLLPFAIDSTCSCTRHMHPGSAGTSYSLSRWPRIPSAWFSPSLRSPSQVPLSQRCSTSVHGTNNANDALLFSIYPLSVLVGVFTAAWRLKCVRSIWSGKLQSPSAYSQLGMIRIDCCLCIHL